MIYSIQYTSEGSALVQMQSWGYTVHLPSRYRRTFPMVVIGCGGIHGSLRMDAPSDSVDLAGLGRFIRERRQALHLTQHQLADRVYWSQERISVVENGKYGTPSVQALARLASALQCSLVEVLDAAGFEGGCPGIRGDQGTDAAYLYALQRLFEIEAGSLKAALDRAATIVAEVMGAEKVDAFIYEPEIESLVALGSSNTLMGRREVRAGMNRLPLANGGREVEVFQSGTPYQSGQAKEDPGMLRGFTRTLGVQAVLTVSLEVRGKRRGVLVAQTSQADHFVPGDLPFLTVIAQWVGMVADRADLVEQLRRASSEQGSDAQS